MTRIPHLPSLYMIRKFTFLLLSSRHEHVFNFPFKMIVSKLKPLEPWGSAAKQMIWFSSKVVMSNLLIENVYNQVYCSWNDWFTIKWLKLLKMRMLWTQVSIVGKTTKAVGTGVVQGTKVGFLQLFASSFLCCRKSCLRRPHPPKPLTNCIYLMVIMLLPPICLESDFSLGRTQDQQKSLKENLRASTNRPTQSPINPPNPFSFTWSQVTRRFSTLPFTLWSD